MTLLTLSAHAQDGYSSLFVCVFVCLSVTTSLAHLVAKTLKIWTRMGFKPYWDVFKLSRFRKELFGQELRCDLFVMLAC